MRLLESLLDGLRGLCAGLPDKRKGGDVVYSMVDIFMSAFSMLFMQSDSFLAHRRA